VHNIPHELKYTSSHEWVREESDGTLTIGITDHAQGLLGDMVFIELPGEGDELEQGQECGVVESVKAASDFYSPVDGEVVAVNEELEDSPEIVNSEPYHEGWLLKIKPSEETDLSELLDADAYAELVESEDH